MSLFMESAIKRNELLRDWKIWVYKIASIAGELIPGVEVYVVGSIARGDNVGGSDVDILVVSEHVPEKPAGRSRLKALVEERLGLPYYHPFEIHLLKPDEAEYYIERSRGRVVKITS